MKENKYCVNLYTPEGERLSADAGRVPWDVYPRPHMQRDSFFCLNGEWEFSVTSRTEPPRYTEKIRVPFVPESLLSDICRTVPSDVRLCYRREFSLPDGFLNSRALLHVGAADQIAEVFLNGERLAVHRGGYESFSVDITSAVRPKNVLEIFVTDELSKLVLPYGKQCEKRGGMWYTPISGIWQTVWIESVPDVYISEISVVSDCVGADINVTMSDGSECDGEMILHLPSGDTVTKLSSGRGRIEPSEPLLWTPESPHLYRITVRAKEDEVRSYFALRTIDVRQVGDAARLCLNGKPYFFHGLLDQGYFSDGIFLPAEPEGYTRDILAAKKFGFNMLRKHIKTEPEIFYYDCDRLGMAVFQDMVNNGKYSFIRDTALPTVGFKRRDDRRMHRDAEAREEFLRGMESTVKRLAFHPSVCVWTIFNEGWGQFDHAAAYKRLKAIDATRPVDSVSGWFLPPRGKELLSDFDSSHVYFKPIKLTASEKPSFLSEFGGYSYKIEGHSFNLKNNYGYSSYSSQREFEDALERLYIEQVVPAVREGLCAAVYTQLTDVEDETNGLLTYDRRVEKADVSRLLAISDALKAAFIDACKSK